MARRRRQTQDNAPPPNVAALLEPYLTALGPLDREGRPKTYPGSPAIAQILLRAQDRIALAELHPEDRAALVANMGRDRRLAIVELDGYVALNAWLPPKENRGLALIDPPFETLNEAKRLVESLASALRKWPRGIYALWRPIKDRQEDGRFLNALAALGAPNMLRLELDIGEARFNERGERSPFEDRPHRREPAACSPRGGAPSHALSRQSARARRARGLALRVADGAALRQDSA